MAKKYLYPLYAIFMILPFVSACTEALPVKEIAVPGDVSINKTGASPLEGAWELISSETNGKTTRYEKPAQIKLFTGGYFSLIMKDSTGRSYFGIAGPFEVNGNVYKETATYSTISEYIGFSDWQEFELKQDTLYFKLFTKMLDAQGRDITDTVKTTETRVRAKRWF
jgi:hypothetical protein